jgi:hypothetical protein
MVDGPVTGSGGVMEPEYEPEDRADRSKDKGADDDKGSTRFHCI